MGQAGGVLLTEMIRVRCLSEALARWRQPLATHDPGKYVNLAVSLVFGCEALSRAPIPRGEPGAYGLRAFDPTVSRLIAGLAEDADRAMAAIGAADLDQRQIAHHVSETADLSQQDSVLHCTQSRVDIIPVRGHGDRRMRTIDQDGSPALVARADP